VLLRPQGLPGTAGRGPACPVVWEAGGEIPPPTRLAHSRFISSLFLNRFYDHEASA
jgi:hypothetical protein